MATASSFKEAPLGNGKIEIGRFSHGYDGINFRNWGEGANVSIGSFCNIAENVHVILGGQNQIDRIASFPFGQLFQDELGGEEIVRESEVDVSIGNDVWIGDGVTLMPGVSIGDGAVIATNATVFKDVGPYEIWAGNPATFVKKRFDDEVCAKLMQLKWWNLPEVLLREMAPLLASQPSVELIDSLQSIVDDLVSFEAA